MRGWFQEIPGCWMAKDNMWLRMVPDEWYRAWLRATWPTLHDLLLLAATDEPDAIRLIFREFSAGPAQWLAHFLRDFEILRRAVGHVCNTSFSRVAATVRRLGKNGS
jgi:hypothetical protein